MRCSTALRRFCLAALVAALLAAPSSPPAAALRPPPAEPLEDIEPFSADGAAGTLTLPAGAPDRRTPVVVVLHDGPDPDGRGGRYADQLLGAGIAVLELLAHEGEGAANAVATVAQHPRLAGQPVGVLGFGAGARLALRLPHPIAARGLLYPGCARPPAEVAPVAGEAILLLHGAEDGANPPADCAALADRLARQGAAVRWLAYNHASYAWDRPIYGAEGPRHLLPSPVGGGLVASVSWPELAEFSASEVAGFFATALRPR